jgi:hypothetical protein
MTASIIDLVDGVVTALAAFGAVKDLAPVFKSEEITSTQVVVIAGPETWTKLDRGTSALVTYDVIVLVQGKYTNNLPTFMALVESIKQTAMTLRLSEIIQQIPYDQIKLYEDSVFTTQITLRFKGFQ